MDKKFKRLFTIRFGILPSRLNDFDNCLKVFESRFNSLTSLFGKTKSAKAALNLIGNMGSFYSSVKERFIPRLCSRTTLPPVLDDVKKHKLIEDIAMAFYNNVLMYKVKH